MPTQTETTLKLERAYSATPQQVFRAWIDPDQLKKWHAPSDEFEVPVAEVDAREGGSYRIEMKQGEESHNVFGTYREVSEPDRLVFTWAWESNPEKVSLVTVEIREQDGGSVLTLTHEGFVDADQRGRHEHGWNALLDRLPSVL